MEEVERVKEYIEKNSHQGVAIISNDVFVSYDSENGKRYCLGTEGTFLTDEDLLKYYQSNRDVIDEYLSNEIGEKTEATL